jgi:ketosteroid isomerase-like protein
MWTHLEALLLVLAQFFSSPPAPLPGPGFLERFVLDSPVVLMLVLFLGALVALMVCRGLGKPRRGMVIALAFVVMAAGAWMAASLIETDREAIKRGSRELIAAVATVDTAALDRLMADNVVMRYRYSRGDIGKAEIVSHVERYLGREHPIKSHAVLHSEAVLEGERVGRSQIQVQATAQRGESLTSWWRLDWAKDASGRWRVTRISPLHDLIRAR